MRIVSTRIKKLKQNKWNVLQTEWDLKNKKWNKKENKRRPFHLDIIFVYIRIFFSLLNWPNETSWNGRQEKTTYTQERTSRKKWNAIIFFPTATAAAIRIYSHSLLINLLLWFNANIAFNVLAFIIKIINWIESSLVLCFFIYDVRRCSSSFWNILSFWKWSLFVVASTVAVRQWLIRKITKFFVFFFFVFSFS